VELINSETAIIEQIGKNSLTLKFEDGKSKSITTDQLKHIDYGYCITVHASQGKTFDNTIAAINNNKLLNNQKSWLVAISRHRNEFRALVEDKSTLKTYLIKNKGTEISAIEFQSKSLQNQGSILNDLLSRCGNGKINKMDKLQSAV
jgi:ATP-dependent exoDNAse (exonuclease V) alpha subunit